MPISTNSNEMETKSNKTETKSSTGLEHQQTLRTWTSIVIFKLKLKFDNRKLEIWTGENLKKIEKIGNLGRTFREKRLEIWKKYRNLGKLS